MLTVHNKDYLTIDFNFDFFFLLAYFMIRKDEVYLTFFIQV